MISCRPSVLKNAIGGWCWLWLALLGVGAAAPLSAQPTTLAEPAAGASTAVVVRLKELLEIAPSRAVGSEGNQRLVAYFRQHFAQLAQQQNDPQRQASAQTLLAQAQTLAQALDAQRLNLLLPAPAQAQLEAPAPADVLQAERAAAAALQGLWQSGTIPYAAGVFLPGAATLQVGDARVRVEQLAPNLVEPGNLPPQGLTGKLVYVGAATAAELAGLTLDQAIVLLDFASEKRWLEVVQLGAAAVVFLEPADESLNQPQAMAKLTHTPLAVPRFYLPRDAAAKLLGPLPAGPGALAAQATLEQTAPGRWERQELTIEWLLIPGATAPAPSIANLIEDPGRQLVHLQAYLDADSIVPALAPGASSAVNLALLLEQVEAFRTQPPARPVLVSVVNGHCNALLAEQHYANAVAARPAALQEVLTYLERELAQRQFIAATFAGELTPDLLERLRYETVTVAGQSVKLNKPALEFLRYRRNRLRLEASWLRQRAHDSLDENEVQQLRAQAKALEERVDGLNEYMGLFNRLGRRTEYSSLSPQRQQEARAMLLDVAAEAEHSAQALLAQRRLVLDSLAIRRRLAPLSLAQDTLGSDNVFFARHPPLPAVAAVCLDLSFGSDYVGFFAFGNFGGHANDVERPATNRVARLARHTVTLAAELAQQNNLPNRLTDTLLLVGGVPWSAHLGAPVAMGSRPLHLLAIPALTLTSVRDGRLREFTPGDTLAHLETANLRAVTEYVSAYLPALINSADLGKTFIPSDTIDPLNLLISARLTDEYTVGLPQQRMEQALVLGLPKRQAEKHELRFGQVRPYAHLMTDASGLVHLPSGMYRSGGLQAYQYDPSYQRLVATLDFVADRKFNSALNDLKRGDIFKPRIIVGFECVKLDLVGLTHPANLMPLAQLQVLDARQDATPRRYALAGMQAVGSGKLVPLANDGSASVMAPPGLAVKLLSGSALVINADEDHPQGQGFVIGAGRLNDLVTVSAQDMWRLTDNRLSMLESKGVVNDAARKLNDAAGELLDTARQASVQGSHSTALTDAEEARGLAYWAYLHARDAINDLIKAAVFFLALVIPFCFFMTKLVSPFTDVNRQIALFALVFVLTALVLWLLHPAFKVAETPAVVMLGFVILGLAVFVASVVIGRFNASMNQAIEQMQQSEAVDAPQGRLLGVAFLVGVNNMKRRRIRTSLTCATIILVTFTMLSVISVGQDVEPARVRTGGEPAYSGFLFSRPGLGPISPVQMNRLRAHFTDSSAMAARAWVQRTDSTNQYIDFPVLIEGPDGKYDPQGPQLATKVLLGLEPAEDGLVRQLPLAPGSRWFSSAQAAEIVLSVEAGKLLGITPATLGQHHVNVQGRRLLVVGLMEDAAFGTLRDLGDVPLAPLLSEANSKTALSNAVATADQAAASGLGSGASAGGDLLSQPGIAPARAIDIAMIPLELALSFPDASYRSLSVRYNQPADTGETARAAALKAWQAASKLIRFQLARLDVGVAEPISLGEGKQLPAGQYSLASSSGTQIGGVLKVAIPIILTATIIFNTMLGSVMERRREVGIYNAIGLNPSHVIMFFLAESLVFGMIGAVAGYLIGQAVSLFITTFNLLELNLNYSSTSVLVVIFLTIATVVLSTVYPALMAARAAVPSGQRRWALPQPEGDEITVQFPFSYDGDRVLAVCAYLRDYMQQHAEASTGSFLAQLGPLGRVPATAGGEEQPYVMLFDVAPAPFDLGVNQRMEVYAFYNHRVKAHMLSVHLTRQSGQKSDWMAVNQPFLEALRKRLLGWRSQRAPVQESFYRQGQALFAAAPLLPAQAQEHEG